MPTKKPRVILASSALSFSQKNNYSNSRVSEETQKYETGARRGGSKEAVKPVRVHGKAEKFWVQQKVQERGFR